MTTKPTKEITAEEFMKTYMGNIAKDGKILVSDKPCQVLDNTPITISYTQWGQKPQPMARGDILVVPSEESNSGYKLSDILQYIIKSSRPSPTRKGHFVA